MAHLKPVTQWVVGEQSKRTEFTCQHGPNECRGNRAQACALYEIEQTIKAEDQQQQKKIDVVNCVMASRNPASAVIQVGAVYARVQYYDLHISYGA